MSVDEAEWKFQRFDSFDGRFSHASNEVVDHGRRYKVEHTEAVKQHPSLGGDLGAYFQ